MFKINNKHCEGFSKIFTVLGVIILLPAILLLLDYTAPPDKKVIFKAQPVSQTNTNSGNAPKYETTNFKNNLNVEWKKTDKIPSLNSYITPKNGNVYVASDINFCNTGGKKLLLDLYSNRQPDPNNLHPMIIYVHGGGLIAGDKSQIDADMSKIILSLVENGYIIASINYRLAPQFKYPAMIQDVLCADRFLRYYSSSFGGDQNKIGIFGDSVGGQLSSLVGATSGVESWEYSGDLQIAGADLTGEEYLKIPTKPNAVVTFYGGSNLPESKMALFMVQHIIGSWHNPFDNKDYPISELFKMIYGLDPIIMHEAGAGNYVTKNEPPFLIVQGDKDTLNPPDLSTTFYYQLKSKDNNVRLLIVKNAGHGLEPSPVGATLNPSLTEVVQTTVDFFKSNLR